MKSHLRFYGLVVAGLLLAAGCSALPGLQVLSGQVSGNTAAEQLVSTTDLVMADKSGVTDPALNAAADRIESANEHNVDIIEIRKDLNKDIFTVYMLVRPPNQNTTQADQLTLIRRAIELTWQGTMNQSRGLDVLEVILIAPVPVPTLDKGLSFVGIVDADTQISRQDAVAYLNHRPNTASDFSDLIVQGKLTVNQPTTQEWYEGTPNHSVFLPAELRAQLQGQQSSGSGG